MLEDAPERSKDNHTSLFFGEGPGARLKQQQKTPIKFAAEW